MALFMMRQKKFFKSQVVRAVSSGYTRYLTMPPLEALTPGLATGGPPMAGGPLSAKVSLLHFHASVAAAEQSRGTFHVQSLAVGLFQTLQFVVSGFDLFAG